MGGIGVVFLMRAQTVHDTLSQRVMYRKSLQNSPLALCISDPGSHFYIWSMVRVHSACARASTDTRVR